MKKVLVLIVSVLLCLCAACSGKSSEEPAPAQNSAAAESSKEQASQPAESVAPAESAAESTAPIESLVESVTESAVESVAEEPEPEAAVSLTFDPVLYQDPGDQDRYNILTYGTNSGDVPAMVTFKYKAIDKDGNALAVFNMLKGTYSETFRDSVFIPAGVENYPIAFALPTAFKYDFSTGTEMPEIDHMDYEILEIANMDTEDFRDHFTPGEHEIKNGHLYIYVKYDQEIGDNYSSMYPDYTLLGYSNGTLTTVCCLNCYPASTTSFSVSYTKENTDSSFLVYHDLPRDPVDTWELYLGCVGAEK